MNVSLVAAAQRPKGLPKSFLTELSQLYMFHLANADDIQHLEDMGIPGDVRNPPLDHTFYYFDRYNPASAGYYRLAL